MLISKHTKFQILEGTNIVLKSKTVFKFLGIIFLKIEKEHSDFI